MQSFTVGQKECFKALAIEPTNDTEVIKKAYKARALLWHPDRTNRKIKAEILKDAKRVIPYLRDDERASYNDRDVAVCQAKMKEINKAREELLKLSKSDTAAAATDISESVSDEDENELFKDCFEVIIAIFKPSSLFGPIFALNEKNGKIKIDEHTKLIDIFKIDESGLSFGFRTNFDNCPNYVGVRGSILDKLRSIVSSNVDDRNIYVKIVFKEDIDKVRADILKIFEMSTLGQFLNCSLEDLRIKLIALISHAKAKVNQGLYSENILVKLKEKLNDLEMEMEIVAIKKAGLKSTFLGELILGANDYDYRWNNYHLIYPDADIRRLYYDQDIKNERILKAKFYECLQEEFMAKSSIDLNLKKAVINLLGFKTLDDFIHAPFAEFHAKFCLLIKFLDKQEKNSDLEYFIYKILNLNCNIFMIHERLKNYQQLTLEAHLLEILEVIRSLNLRLDLGNDKNETLNALGIKFETYEGVFEKLRIQIHRAIQYAKNEANDYFVKRLEEQYLRLYWLLNMGGIEKCRLLDAPKPTQSVVVTTTNANSSAAQPGLFGVTGLAQVSKAMDKAAANTVVAVNTAAGLSK